MRPQLRSRRLAAAGVALALSLGATACAAADKNVSASAANASGAMAGMNMGGGSAGSSAAGSGSVPEVNGIKAIPSQLLATAYWQGMKISARTMTAAPFVIFNGTSEQVVRPPKNVSFHLMVDLDDAHTGEPIPYASVWVRILKQGRIVYNERQWPMLSAFMGPHYGNDVALPGVGRYQLQLLISPPIAARHMEYAHVWLSTHTVTRDFTWTDPA